MNEEAKAKVEQRKECKRAIRHALREHRIMCGSN